MSERNIFTPVMLLCVAQLNLASQSVLEGLNACLDHRAEVYIAELGRSFSVQHEKTRLFACQNPLHQGGGRKGLPKSFLNRFTQVCLFLPARISPARRVCSVYPCRTDKLKSIDINVLVLL